MRDFFTHRMLSCHQNNSFQTTGGVGVPPTGKMYS